MKSIPGRPWPTLAAYGMLRMPLALLELPLFVLLPSFYGRHLGVPLAIVGAVLFAMRALDAIADPLIGRTIDRLRHRVSYRRWIHLALAPLALGFAAMFLPPVPPAMLGAWLAASSALTYVAYSAVSIAYQAWGAEISPRPDEQARITGLREGFGLIGVVLAATLLDPQRAPWLVALFVSLALVSAIALRAAPRQLAPTLSHTEGAWRDVIANRAFRWLLGAFMLNGIATAIPATLVLFYIEDVLGAPGSSSQLLLVYFLAGAIGMPVWVRIARHIGLRNAWLLGMSTSVAAFAWALGLGAGDVRAFGWVCAATGFALGADLAMPPAMLAMTIKAGGHRGRLEGRYFGAWHLATKLNLALAAGIALWLLAASGYRPGSGGATLTLSLTYAALPSVLKLAAGVVLLIAPQTRDEYLDPAQEARP